MLMALSMVLVLPGLVHADELRIALVGASDRLEQATITTLGPWRTTVVMLAAEPIVDDGSLARRGRDLVVENRVKAVIWIGERENQQMLWFYDAKSERLETRAVPGRASLDDAGAAAVALTIKTLLRNNELLPQILESEESEESEERSQVDPDAADSDAPLGNGQESVQEARDETAPEPTHTIELVAHGGLRAGLSSDSSSDPRWGLTVAWSPSGLVPGHALELEVRLGPDTSVDRSGLVGQFSDTALRIAVRRTLFASGAGLSVAASLGASLHATRIQGTLSDTGQPADVSRINSGGFGRVRASFAIRDRWIAAVHVTGCSMLQRQLYEVNGASAYSVSQYSIEAGAGLGVLLGW